MADDDAPVAIGGAIDLAVQIIFVDPTDPVQAVSDDAADTAVDVEITYLDSTDVVLDETVSLNGLTPEVFAATDVSQLLKAIKSGTTVGNIAVEAQTAEFEDDGATAFDADSVTLAATAPLTSHLFTGMVVRITGGTGAGQIRRAVHYVGRKLEVNNAFSVTLDATSVVRVSKGMVFEKTPSEVLEVRRLHYNPEAAAAGGADRAYVDKFFIKNTSGADDLLAAAVSEFADPSTFITFALETTLNGTGTNGGGNNRLVPPVSGVGAFDSSGKAVATGDLTFGDAQGVWSKLSLADGQAASETTETFAIGGTA